MGWLSGSWVGVTVAALAGVALIALVGLGLDRAEAELLRSREPAESGGTSSPMARLASVTPFLSLLILGIVPSVAVWRSGPLGATATTWGLGAAAGLLCVGWLALGRPARDTVSLRWAAIVLAPVAWLAYWWATRAALGLAAALVGASSVVLVWIAVTGARLTWVGRR